MTASIAAALLALSAKITSHHDALVACDESVPKAEARLAAHNAALEKAMASCDCDNPAAVTAIVEGQAQQRLLQNALRAIPGQRRQVMEELVGTLGELDKIVLPFAVPETCLLTFADLKNCEFARCDQATLFIFKILNPTE